LSGARRHAWKAAHGFRKYYKSRAEQMMRPINVEITMGHNIGISASYYRPTEREVLEDYLKAVDLLTIHDDKVKLEKKIQELKERTEDSKKVIDSRLEQKDSEILEWKKKYLKDVKGLIQQMDSMKEFQKETQKELGELKRRYWSHVNMSMRP
jgi:guanylate kinase